MITQYDPASLISGAVGLALILFCSIPSFLELTSTVWTLKRYTLAKVYEDKDGVATEEGTEKFSAKVPKIIIATLSLLGLAVSTTLAVLGTLGWAKDGLFIESWINCGAWVCWILNT
jgi:hypothetical protein